MKTVLRLFTLFTMTILFLSSCNKENFNNQNLTSNNFSSSKGESDFVTIASFEEGDAYATLFFDKDIFTSLFQEELTILYGDNFIFDDISIWDEDPFDMDNKPALRISILETNSGKTTSLFMMIEKKHTDYTVQYILKKKKKTVTVVECIGSCKKGGCYVNRNKTGCEPCKDSGSQCDSRVQTIYLEDNNGGGSNPWLHTIIGVAVTILVALIFA